MRIKITFSFFKHNHHFKFVGCFAMTVLLTDNVLIMCNKQINHSAWTQIS